MRPVAICLLILGLGGCAGTAGVAGSIERDAAPAVRESLWQPHGCQVSVRVIDRRAETDKGEDARPHTRLFLPLIFAWYSSKGGPELLSSEQLDPDPPTSLSRLVKRIISESGLVSLEGPAYQLEVELLRYQSLSYREGSFFLFVAPGAAIITDVSKSSWPVGSALLRLTLRDQDGAEVAQRTLNSGHLASFEKSDEEPAPPLLSELAADALRESLSQLPQTLDEMLTAALDEGLEETPTRFVVARLSRDRRFVQEIEAEVLSGRILSNDWRARRGPVFARPGDWVVAPYTADGAWLSAPGYRALLDALAKAGHVAAFEENLSAARYLATPAVEGQK